MVIMIIKEKNTNYLYILGHIKDKLKDAFHVTHDEIANINILENFIPRGL